jgi:proteasome lid subunit RPN8/RPN11
VGADVRLELSGRVLARLRRHGEDAYAEEGVGLLLGRTGPDGYVATDIAPLPNGSPDEERRRRYWVGPEEMLRAEQAAERRGLELIGVYHSHPDHPALPSQTDLEMAWPSFAYLITRVAAGRAQETRAWTLLADRSGFEEMELVTLESETEEPR